MLQVSAVEPAGEAGEEPLVAEVVLAVAVGAWEP